MDVSILGFDALLIAAATMRLVELTVSRRNQRRLTEQGARQIRDPHFGWMVITHIGILAGAALEVVFLNRPFFPFLAAIMFSLFLAANAVRWWVIRTLKMQWTVRVMDSARLGVITNGPFCFVRHPNYAAVFVELLALPLVHTAWLTALVGSLMHAWVLARRLAVEEPVLMACPAYRETMALKARFVPGLF